MEVLQDTVLADEADVGAIDIDDCKNEKTKNGKQFVQYDNTYEDNNLNEIFCKKDQFQGMMKKYWNQRYSIFSKYDEGVILTKELWFSVTPESISKSTALIINTAFKGKDNLHVMDAFAGGGGNILQFLKYNDVVYAVDINYIHLYCTKNNVAKYFDNDKIDKKLKVLGINWEYADKTNPDYVNEHYEDDNKLIDNFGLVDKVYANKKESLENLEILENIKVDCIFGSPPWGGPEYMKDKYFNLNHLLPFTLEKLLTVLLQYTDNIVLFLPKNSNLKQLNKITVNVFNDEKMVRVFRMSLYNRPKGLVCCWGPAFVDLDLYDVDLEGE